MSSPHPFDRKRKRPQGRSRTLRHTAVFTLTLLAIEFLDEAASSHVCSGVFGAREAAWPLIRADLGLSYAQVGLLLGLPSVVSSIVEPFLGILGDIWRRRVLRASSSQPAEMTEGRNSDEFGEFNCNDPDQTR